jgi:proteasome lid subunit RPN8/RPN11
MSDPRSTSPRALASPAAKRMGAIHSDAFTVAVYESVLEALLDYSEQDLQRECGGFLIGGLTWEPRRVVAVRHFLPAVEARSRSASLTFTHATWSAMTRTVSERFPDESVVGWHHTHPGLGVFLSGYDLFIHRHFFKEAWQIAVVVDPRQRELGFFQWRGARVVDCGFLCVED